MAPKPPVTAFFIFCKSKRAVMTANCPELTSQQVTKSLGETWNNLSEVNKVIYHIHVHVVVFTDVINGSCSHVLNVHVRTFVHVYAA